MEVGIVLGMLVVNVSIGEIEYPIYTAILSSFFPGDRVAALMKNLANHWNYYSPVEIVYGLRYLTILLIGTMQ